MKKCGLFDGISEQRALSLIRDEGARSAVYRKGDVVFHEGETVGDICIVARGSLEGVRYGIDGVRDVVGIFGEGEVFGDVLAMSGTHGSPVTVGAREDCEVMFIPFENVAGSACGDAGRLLKNLIRTISDKYFSLLFRLNCISCRTLREKILYYLITVSGQRSDPFNIPFDRAELADFLCADRSALSRELSALKKSGVIDYYRNSFKIISFDKARPV